MSSPVEAAASSLGEHPSDPRGPLIAASRPPRASLLPAAKPVVHIRARPALAHLGEHKERRRVWCLDHQNIVVRTTRPQGERGIRAATPRRSNSAPSTPFGSPMKRCHSASPAPRRMRRGRDGALPPPRLVQGRDSSVPRQRHPRTRRTTPIVAQGVVMDAGGGQHGGGVGREEHFLFDFIHDEDATQEEVFEESVLDIVDTALLAQSVAIICYGPTGSGKTYSMMGSTGKLATPSSSTSLTTTTATAGATTSTLHAVATTTTTILSIGAGAGSSSPQVIEERSKRSRFDEKPSHSLKSSGTATDPSAAVRGMRGTRISNGGHATDATASSRSSGFSARDIEWPSASSSFGPRGAAGVEVMEGSETMGLLPRLVRVLLDRRGEAVNLDRTEPAAVGTTRRRDRLSGSGSGSGTGPNSMEEEERFRLTLTLQELMLYGVELYMDEFHDLLDAAKRPLPNVGDIGGLEVFCQKMNAAAPAKGSSTNATGPSGGSGGGGTGGGGGVGRTRSKLRGDAAAPPSSSTNNNAATTTTTTTSTNNTTTAILYTTATATTAAAGGASGGASGGGSGGRRGGGMLISSVEDLRRCYRIASRNRVTKSHQRNDASSRSHAVFILQLRFDLLDSREAVDGGPPRSVYSYVAMVDLAGSERVKETKVEGEALREAQYINKSLSALSAVLLALYQGSGHIPYRDSKLTRLLRPCLECGRVLTLVHVSPCSADETISSLKFAEQVRHTSVQSHNLHDADDGVVAIFEDLIDPELQARAEAYRCTELQHAQLCADIRLAYTTREANGLPVPKSLTKCIPRENEGGEPENEHNRGDEEGILSPTRRRAYAMATLTERHMAGYRAMEAAALHNAVVAIEQERDAQVEGAQRLLKSEAEAMRLAIEQFRAANAQLAEENSQPVLRDAHAIVVTQQLKDTSAEVTACAREKLLLMEGIRVVRQRLLLQGDLENCLDDQLRELRRNLAPNGSARKIQSVSLAVAVESEADSEESRDLAQEQLLLAHEMSLLRKESTCFVRADEIWEGLWARVMRQEFLLAARADVIALERIANAPETIQCVLEASGVDEATARTIAYGKLQTGEVLKKATEALQKATSKVTCAAGDNSLVSNGGRCGLDPIPLTLSSGDTVQSRRLLLHSYNDEAELQSAAVSLLMHDGVHCEVAFITPNNTNNNSNSNNSNSTSSHAATAEILAAATAAAAAAATAQWGLLRLVPSPRDMTAYCLEFTQRTNGGSGERARERRVFSVPLSEPHLRVALDVLEADGVESGPTLLLHLRGFPPAATPGPMRLGPQGITSSLPARQISIARRMSCGGELILPASAAPAGEEDGGAVIVLRFPPHLFSPTTRAEAAECVVAALAGLMAPAISLDSASDSNIHNNTTGAGVAYPHVPHLLLGMCGDHLNGGANTLTPLRGPAISPLSYSTALHVRFHFTNSNSSGNNNNTSSMSSTNNSHTNHNENAKGESLCPTALAVSALRHLGSVSLHLPPTTATESSSSEGEAARTFLARMQQLQYTRSRTRARVRQQLFDAEDIKAELLYSYSEGEFMHASHIRDIQREAREVVDLQRTQSAPTSRAVFHVTPAICRALCGFAVPWTIWHWAHRWAQLRETNEQRTDLLDEMVDDSVDESGSDEATVGGKEIQYISTIVFDDVPCYLACMET